jgi:hypothetical protein
MLSNGSTAMDARMSTAPAGSASATGPAPAPGFSTQPADSPTPTATSTPATTSVRVPSSDGVPSTASFGASPVRLTPSGVTSSAQARTSAMGKPSSTTTTRNPIAQPGTPRLGSMMSAAWRTTNAVAA